jgi:hypothetical protein
MALRWRQTSLVLGYNFSQEVQPSILVLILPHLLLIVLL